MLLAVSAFLPWYADLDSYRIGDQFLGITGPASFVGIVILLLSGLSMWVFSHHLLQKRAPRLPVREAILYMFVGIESLFLLLIVNSIFFHPKFGVNITLKESRFGMTVAIIGGVVLTIGSYLLNREEIKKTDEVGKLEPLIKVEPRIAVSQPQTQASARPQPTVQSQPYARPHMPVSARREEPRRGFLFGERAATSTPAATPHAAPPSAPQTQKSEKPQTHAQPKAEESGGSYMIRMDL